MSIDWNKPVQTRDGRKVRVLCTDARYGSKFCVLALVEVANSINLETLTAYRTDGKFLNAADDNCDLINVPQKRWVNLVRDIHGEIAIHGDYSDEANAKLAAEKYTKNFLKTVEVELP